MKKKISHKRTGVKLSKSNRSKFHRSYKKVEMRITEPGPSKVIIYDENGKVVDFSSKGKTKFKDTLTKVGEEAMASNKKAKLDKKEAIKKILTSAGYDPTIKYSRKERKHFTRLVKNNLFVTPKPVTLTDKEIKKRVTAKKEKRAELLNSRPHAKTVAEEAKKALIDLKKAFKSKTTNVPVVEQKQEFTRVIQRFSDDNPIKNYDFYTDTIEAADKEEALKLSKPLAEKHSNDPKFAGMSITPKGTTDTTYYPKATLLAA